MDFKKNKTKLILALFILVLPILTQALTLGDIINNTILKLYNPILVLIFSLAFIGFFWELSQMIGSSSAEKIKEGKEKIIWGIIILVVMFSIWGIIGIIKNSFTLTETHINTYPNFKVQNNT